MIFQVMKSLDPRKDVVVSFMALWITLSGQGEVTPEKRWRGAGNSDELFMEA
jgi:hypothetical protein